MNLTHQIENLVEAIANGNDTNAIVFLTKVLKEKSKARIVGVLTEETGIADNDIYLLNMSKSFGDKAWFLEYVSPEIDTFVDFGGGAGQFCEFVQKHTKQFVKYIIIDNNPSFASQAAEKGFLTFTGLDELLKSGEFDPEKSLLNMSSVIHEVYSYADEFYDDVGVFWTDIKKCGFKQIAIRDMSVNDSDYKDVPEKSICWIYENVFKDDSIVIGHGSVRRPLSELCDEFEDRWGAICDVQTGRVDVKRLIHFLIKYRYVENWDREVNENYLPVTQDKLQKLLTGMGYSFKHKESSKLAFYAKTWAKDFRLMRPDSEGHRRKFYEWLASLNTHIKWLLER